MAQALALYSFFKATASASRRSPSLLLLHHSRRFTSAASGDRSVAAPIPTDNSFGCFSSSAVDHGQIASPSVLHLLQSRRFTHTSAAGSPTLLQPQFRHFASKPDAETIRDEPSDSEWSSKIYTMLDELRSAFRGDVNHASYILEELRKNLDEIVTVKHMRILHELSRDFREDVNLVNSRLEVAGKRFDEIHRKMKESHSERMKRSDSVEAIWERQMPPMYERNMFSTDDENDYWGHVFIHRGRVSHLLRTLVLINGGCVALLFIIGMLLIKDKGV